MTKPLPSLADRMRPKSLDEVLGQEHIACAPKSNSAYLGIEKALKDVKNKPLGCVPLHLRNPVFEGAKELDYGVDYKYPHDLRRIILKIIKY